MVSDGSKVQTGAQGSQGDSLPAMTKTMIARSRAGILWSMLEVAVTCQWEVGKVIDTDRARWTAETEDWCRQESLQGLRTDAAS